MIDPILNTDAAVTPAAASATGASAPKLAPVPGPDAPDSPRERPAHPLYTIERGAGAGVVARLLDVLFPDAVTILDATYGSGEFWRGQERHVTGLDINPARARDVCADFTRLPFGTGSVDLVVFDPPYITNASKSGTSRMARRFGAYPSLRAMQASVEAGCREAWRVARIGVLVKVQDQIRGGRWIEMTEWARHAIGQAPYQRVDALRPAPKMLSHQWTEQYSAYGNAATFLAFRHGSQYHRERKPMLRVVR